jgi:hypothetical protein
MMRVSRALSLAGSANGICCGDSVENFGSHRKGIWVMGKYVLGWLFGVPVFVLVIVYFLFH